LSSAQAVVGWQSTIFLCSTVYRLGDSSAVRAMVRRCVFSYGVRRIMCMQLQHSGASITVKDGRAASSDRGKRHRSG